MLPEKAGSITEILHEAHNAMLPRPRGVRSFIESGLSPKASRGRHFVDAITDSSTSLEWKWCRL